MANLRRLLSLDADSPQLRSMSHPNPPVRCNTLIPLALLAVALAGGCERGSAPAERPGVQAPAAPAAREAVALEDVVETKPDYIIGISYPKAASAHPGLARALQAYAESARSALMKAVARRPNDSGAPFDLSLQFSGLVDTPGLVVVAADGSSYTGGDHGTPLVARFVWLPEQGGMLTAQELIPDAAGWKVVADACREQLMTLLSQRLAADDLAPADHAEQLRAGSKAIAEGTAPEARNFAQFEPVVDADGRIRSLRFVFPPNQVGPYADGTLAVDLPAALLLPVIAPRYKPLFRGG